MYSKKLGRSGLPARHTALASGGDSGGSDGGGSDLAARTITVVPEVLFHYLGRRPIVGISPEPGTLFADLGKFESVLWCGPCAMENTQHQGRPKGALPGHLAKEPSLEYWRQSLRDGLMPEWVGMRLTSKSELNMGELRTMNML